jgi:DNA-directed RNA polymerase specialized sigma24 family protein
VLAAVPAREREDLSLLVAGFTYAEICELAGGRTYTNVSQRLRKARARIRLFKRASPLASPDALVTARRRR